MTKYQFFTTKEEARKTCKEWQGMIVYAYTKSGRKASYYEEYMFHANLFNVDQKEYPYLVLKKNV